MHIRTLLCVAALGATAGCDSSGDTHAATDSAATDLADARASPDAADAADAALVDATPPPSAVPPAIVPQPRLLEIGSGAFVLTETTRIVAEGDRGRLGQGLAVALRAVTGVDLPVIGAGRAPGDIELVLDSDEPLTAEGYILDVGPEGVRAVAHDEAGLFYATRTLLQLFPSSGHRPGDGPVAAPEVHIEDAPRFSWRGAMLDVARHFFTVDEVKRQIDLMALHKLNRLHLHLTDDQGWRLEILSFPALTAIGGQSEVGGGPSGYYTQAEYSELVAYAADQHITVIPEIDFPGHANAALASVAALNESGERAEPHFGAGVISTPLWLAGPDTWPFVEAVWREVAELTPGPWVHLGGDEAIDTPEPEYIAFMEDLDTHVRALGKSPIGWDEAAVAGLPPPFVVQYWLDNHRAVQVAQGGGQIIASPAAHTYLDMRHDADAEFGQIWAGFVNVEKAYDWDPVDPGLSESDYLGVEAPAWTEFIADEAQLDFMMWPRLAALAEVSWTPQAEREWPDFARRLVRHGERLDALGVGYYRSPEIAWSPR